MTARRGKRKKRGLFNKRSTPDEQEAQREAAFAAIRALYRQSLPLWRACGRGRCRRHRGCFGDSDCLTRAWPLLPEAAQEAAHALVIAGGPRRRPPANHVEWMLRQYPPTNFVL
jgi:hypothetical protein